MIMEALYGKLYDKYSRLKTRKWLEVEELNREQEVKFLTYFTAADELIEHLRNENNRLHAEVSDLRNEMASIRSTKYEQYTEFQKLLVEENEKNKELSEEVERLRNLQKEGLCCREKDDGTVNTQPNTLGDAQVGSDSTSGLGTKLTRKRRKHFVNEMEISVNPSDRNQMEHARVGDSGNDLSKHNMSSGDPLNIHQPECCGRKMDGSGGGADFLGHTKCMFQVLVEYLVGMKLSTVTQTDGICISALHQSSGYSFSLTWMNKSTEEEAELLYRVSSLGTFERVAPDWTREVLMFSLRMCPIFFERVSRIINLHH